MEGVFPAASLRPTTSNEWIYISMEGNYCAEVDAKCGTSQLMRGGLFCCMISQSLKDFPEQTSISSQTTDQRTRGHTWNP